MFLKVIWRWMFFEGDLALDVFWRWSGVGCFWRWSGIGCFLKVIWPWMFFKGYLALDVFEGDLALDVFLRWSGIGCFFKVIWYWNFFVEGDMPLDVFLRWSAVGCFSKVIWRWMFWRWSGVGCFCLVGNDRCSLFLPMLRDAGTDSDGWMPSLSSWSQPSSLLSSYHRRPWLTVASQRGRFPSAHPLRNIFLLPWNAQSGCYGSEDWPKPPKCPFASRPVVQLAVATTLFDWMHLFCICICILYLYFAF